MGPDMIVLIYPFSDDNSGLFQRMKIFQIETFIPQAPIKSLIKSILPRRSRLNIGCVYAQAFKPVLQHMRRKFTAIITSNIFRNTLGQKEGAQNINDIIAFKLIIHPNHQAFPGVFINHRQHPDFLAETKATQKQQAKQDHIQGIYRQYWQTEKMLEGHPSVRSHYKDYLEGLAKEMFQDKTFMENLKIIDAKDARAIEHLAAGKKQEKVRIQEQERIQEQTHSMTRDRGGLSL